MSGQPSRGRRRGAVFPLRLTENDRAALKAAQAQGGGPRALGPWLVWRALGNAPAEVLPRRPGITAAIERVLPPPGSGNTRSRLILDLCGGSGSWSRPYAEAGYTVRVVDLAQGDDVVMFEPPAEAWGVLAAPPCTEFSLAKNGQPRDFRAGLEVVSACLRVVAACHPQWWALENPAGYLSRWLGAPRDSWEPCDFGDPWTKRTAIWGDFALPRRGPFVTPTGSAMDRTTAAERAITPPGFVRAFFEANP